MKRLLIIILICFGINPANAQTQPKQITDQKESKFRFGFTYFNVWSTVKGTTPEIFTKPSIGGNVKMEYYPLDFLGFTAGIGYQQRGYGLILPDTGVVAPSINTYRNRIRMNSVEFPIGIIFKTPKPIAQGSTHLMATIGISPLYLFEVNDVFLDIEGGMHNTTDITNEFNQRDMPIFVSIGPELDSSAGYLQILLIGSFGTSNVFSSENNPNNYSAKQRYFGLSVAYTF